MRPLHWFVLLVILVLLFGASKLPELAQSIGKSAKILKHELKDLQNDDNGDIVSKTDDAQTVSQTPKTPIGQAPGSTRSSTYAQAHSDRNVGSQRAQVQRESDTPVGIDRM